jgi:hypothetical protein
LLFIDSGEESLVLLQSTMLNVATNANDSGSEASVVSEVWTSKVEGSENTAGMSRAQLKELLQSRHKRQTSESVKSQASSEISPEEIQQAEKRSSMTEGITTILSASDSESPNRPSPKSKPAFSKGTAKGYPAKRLAQMNDAQLLKEAGISQAVAQVNAVFNSGKKVVYGRDVTDCQSLFQALDLENSGVVPKQSIVKGLKRLGIHLSDAILEALVDTMDENGNGSITLESLKKSLDPLNSIARGGQSLLLVEQPDQEQGNTKLEMVPVVTLDIPKDGQTEGLEDSPQQKPIRKAIYQSSSSKGFGKGSGLQKKSPRPQERIASDTERIEKQDVPQTGKEQGSKAMSKGQGKQKTSVKTNLALSGLIPETEPVQPLLTSDKQESGIDKPSTNTRGKLSRSRTTPAKLFATLHSDEDSPFWGEEAPLPEAPVYRSRRSSAQKLALNLADNPQSPPTPNEGRLFEVPTWRPASASAIAAASNPRNDVIARFVSKLRRYRGCSLRAWREDFDKCEAGWTSQVEFSKACRFYGFGSDQLWANLCIYRGQPSLKFWELDHEEARNYELFEEVLWTRTGFDLERAWDCLDCFSKGAIALPEFARNARALGFRGDPVMLFKGLDRSATGRLCKHDFMYVEKLSPVSAQLANLTRDMRLFRGWVMQEFEDAADLLLELHLITNYAGGYAQLMPPVDAESFAASLTALGYPGNIEEVTRQAASKTSLSLGTTWANTDSSKRYVTAPSLWAALSGSRKFAQLWSEGSENEDLKGVLQTKRQSSPKEKRPTKRNEWDATIYPSDLANRERPSALRNYFSVPEKDWEVEAKMASSQPGSRQGTPSVFQTMFNDSIQPRSPLSSKVNSPFGLTFASLEAMESTVSDAVSLRVRPGELPGVGRSIAMKT